MLELSLEELNVFIVKAKANSYIGRAEKSLPSRLGSHDIQFREADYQYLDSYFGGTDFLGQEVVYLKNEPIWAMNYYGKILEPASYDGEKAGNAIIESLSKLYKKGQFLGEFSNETLWGKYTDTNKGDVSSFTGYEWIDFGGKKVYELYYHGGLIKP